MENSDDEYERPDVIIDNGSSYMKCGLSGEEGPRAVIRSCVGYPKKKYYGFGG
jgi:actin-related protein